MKQQQQNIFHKFIVYADRMPKQAKIFPFFQFMDISIRKSFNQLKKVDNKKIEGLEKLQRFWAELNNEDRVNLYCKWADLLHMALKVQKNPSFKFPKESATIQDQIYMKSTNFFSKWEHKIVKLTPTHLLVKNNKYNKQYQLKDYEFRNFHSTSKQLQYAWILQPINKNGATLFCSVKTQQIYNQWFYSLVYNIDNARVTYFCKCIQMQRENPGSSKELQLQNQKPKKNKKMKKVKSKKSETQIKTLTQIVIEKEMKDINEEQDDEEINDIESLSREDSYKEEVVKGKIEGEQNPNIFGKLLPDHQPLYSFSDTPNNCPLLLVMPEYRIFEIPQYCDQQQNISTLKLYTVLPYPKSLIFKVLTSDTQQMKWNTQIDMIHIKTKISSQNSVLFYEKNKSQGILYRERDFLYLRHCFSMSNTKYNNSFIVDKSIDSIHLPPFMTVVRAEKQMIYGLFQKPGDKNSCQIVVEGWMLGGGYMNMVQNREMTQKYLKKIAALGDYLKTLTQQQKSSIYTLFKEEWKVAFENEQSQQCEQSDQSEKSIDEKIEEDVEYNEQMEQFMEKTRQENMSYVSSEKKSEVNASESKFEENFNTPPINEETQETIIPKEYLTYKYQTEPRAKPKKPKLFPHINGHHLFLGEWQLSSKGGLKYIDEEKMRQQKKVLTYIIKRIGKNIFSGKGILNISLPVDIFCMESNIERIAKTMGFFPHYLEMAAKTTEPEIQLKYIVGAGIGSSLIYLTIEKPFNPILGQTYQCYIDQCPIYFEQISHHPPIAAFLMIGRGYKVSGNVQAKMQLSVNSGTGNNEGIFTIEFDNGSIFYFTTPAGCLSGVTYGQRKLNMVGKCYYWSKSGMFLEIIYNPSASRKSFFGGNKTEGDEGLSDYIEGFAKHYDIQNLKSIAFSEGPNGQLIPKIPKSSPKQQPLKTFYKIHGRWNSYVMCDNQKIFDVDTTRYYSATQERVPLPSNSNYREDIVYRRLKNFVLSQQFKEKLEIKQRNDRKLRSKFSQNS